MKLPVALSGGSSANVLPVPGDQAVDVASQLQVGKGVDGDARRLADAHVGHLRLLVVGDHPDVRQRHDGDHLRADIDELAGPHLALADQAVRRRHDPRVAEVVRASATCASAAWICACNCFS